MLSVVTFAESSRKRREVYKFSHGSAHPVSATRDSIVRFYSLAFLQSGSAPYNVTTLIGYTAQSSASSTRTKICDRKYRGEKKFLPYFSRLLHSEISISQSANSRTLSLSVAGKHRCFSGTFIKNCVFLIRSVSRFPLVDRASRMRGRLNKRNSQLSVIIRRRWCGRRYYWKKITPARRCANCKPVAQTSLGSYLPNVDRARTT